MAAAEVLRGLTFMGSNKPTLGIFEIYLECQQANIFLNVFNLLKLLVYIGTIRTRKI